MGMVFVVSFSVLRELVGEKKNEILIFDDASFTSSNSTGHEQLGFNDQILQVLNSLKQNSHVARFEI